MTAWLEKDQCLVKEFGFGTFQEALAFINNIGVLAEQCDHHPDLFLHNYNQVKVLLSTHSAGKITNKDYELAKLIDNLLE
ncbi:MAG: 4a-hydroxytetrahydrobiopterin dehydratase [Candidatus Abawacabacteria bacterium]|nr:4a-hydroxytetrahydrobiopterin dehydratase [Candidatus Abawacabacteria bacterium]